MSTLNIEKLFGVKGYVALVTGGTSGLGFMISKGLVTNGAKVYVVALPTEPIEEKVSELNEIGRHAGGSAIGQAKNSRSLMFDPVTDMRFLGSPATSAKRSP